MRMPGNYLIIWAEVFQHRKKAEVLISASGGSGFTPTMIWTTWKSPLYVCGKTSADRIVLNVKDKIALF